MAYRRRASYRPAYRPPMRPMAPLAPSKPAGMSKNAKIALTLAAVALVGFMVWPKEAKAETPPTRGGGEPSGGGGGGPAFGTYEVKSGDSLSQIAANVYGDGRKPNIKGDQGWRWWPYLYDLNRDVIGGNPNRIFPGQVLKIPPASALPMDRKDEIFRRSIGR